MTKLVSKITDRDVDFAKWYTDVVREADLVAYSSVKGSMIIRPYGYAIWENIQRILDAEFPKYFASIDIYQMRYIIPLEFQKPTRSTPAELIGNLDIPSGAPLYFHEFDYSDEHRTIIQKEQPYSKLC